MSHEIGVQEFEKFFAKAKEKRWNPIEAYLHWEYWFLRFNLVPNAQEFAEQPIPCTLDLINKLSEEMEALDSGN